MKIHHAAFILAAAIELVPTAARAQDNSAAAEALFHEGRQLFQEKRYPEACPKFSESFRLDPATGSLLALAACHEAEGKLASAWAEYTDVASRSRREGRNDRADQAQQRAAMLAPKLGKLRLVFGPGASEVPSLVVKRDGVALGSAAMGAALPVDRGEHVIDVSAQGYVSVTLKTTVLDGGLEQVAIPRLVAAPAPAPSPAPVPVDVEPRATGGAGLPLRTIGIVAGGAGIVALGVGGYFGVQAVGKNSDSKANGHCSSDDVCDATGTQLRKDAIHAGNASTVLFVVGGVLAAGGVVLWIVGAPHDETKPQVAVMPFALHGRF